jgi:hypothetical protein
MSITSVNYVLGRIAAFQHFMGLAFTGEKMRVSKTLLRSLMRETERKAGPDAFSEGKISVFARGKIDGFLEFFPLVASGPKQLDVELLHRMAYILGVSLSSETFTIEKELVKSHINTI